MNPTTAALLKEGQSIWQDDISRSMLTGGELAAAISETGIRGVTSNPTIFEKAISGSDAYDEQIAELATKGLSSAEIFETLAIQDIRDACDLFLPVYEQTAGGDGFVSIEVPPDLARDADGTREAVRRLWDGVDRSNVMVKIPGTVECIPVIEEMLAEGKNINITLLFSLNAYKQVARAYLNAIEGRVNSGKPVAMVASVASFFVSRVDTAVDALLDSQIVAATSKGETEALESLKGKAAVANAKLAYELFQQMFSGKGWERLTEAGAKVQRPLWASTGTKNPAYSDVLYVEPLIGPYTVNTMPRKTTEAFLDHGQVERTVDQDLDEAKAVMEGLSAVGIDIDQVTDDLEAAGIVAFEKSFDTLLAEVDRKRIAYSQPATVS